MADPAPKPIRRRATVIDVAREAGVSPSTVSNVLNGRPVLRDETRRRVQAAIAALGYERSVAAHGLRTSSMPVLGLLIEDDSRRAMRDQVHGGLLAGLLERARQRGLGVSVFAAAPESDDQAIVRFVASGHAAGIVLSIQGAEGERFELLSRLAATGVPLIVFERRQAPHGVGSVATDNAGGSRLIFEHLHALGHRDFLYVGSAVKWPGPEDRLAAFVEAAAAAGVAWHMERAPGWTSDAAYSATLPLLQRHRPTAVVAGNDDLAAGVMEAAAELGMDVPGSLSVTGFSDLEVAQRVVPQLTTVSFDPAAEGELAADHLIARMSGGAPSESLLVPARLVLRASTGPARTT